MSLLKDGLVERRDLVRRIKHFIISEGVDLLLDDEIEVIYNIITKRIKEEVKK